jgi:DNA repair exonuclease SbcCD ATPase subunit
MDSVVPVVAARANKYLEILADGDLRIKLDTLTTLKGGGVREKLSFTTTVEGQQDVPMSGGQLKKVTLATDLALMDLLAKREGAAVDLLLLDEVLDGLDAAGRSRIMDLLSHLRSQRSTIIVISHDPEIVEKFGKTITVIKKNGIARLAS